MATICETIQIGNEMCDVEIELSIYRDDSYGADADGNRGTVQMSYDIEDVKIWDQEGKLIADWDDYEDILEDDVLQELIAKELDNQV